MDGDEIEERSADVIGYLEGIADGSAGRSSLRAAIDGLPARLGAVAREPAVAAALTDYAGDYGATPMNWRCAHSTRTTRSPARSVSSPGLRPADPAPRRGSAGKG